VFAVGDVHARAGLGDAPAMPDQATGVGNAQALQLRQQRDLLLQQGVDLRYRHRTEPGTVFQVEHEVAQSDVHALDLGLDALRQRGGQVLRGTFGAPGEVAPAGRLRQHDERHHQGQQQQVQQQQPPAEAGRRHHGRVRWG